MSGAGDLGVAAKLVGFAAVLVVVFVVAFGLGAATEDDAPPNGPTPTSTTLMDRGHGAEHGS